MHASSFTPVSLLLLTVAVFLLIAVTAVTASPPEPEQSADIIRFNKWLEKISSDPENLDTLASWVCNTQGGISWDAYLEGMARPQAWGDEITLMGIVETYGVRIMLVSSTDDPDNCWSLFRPKEGGDKVLTLWMSHFLELHYDSLHVLPMQQEEALAAERAREEKVRALEAEVAQGIT